MNYFNFSFNIFPFIASFRGLEKKRKGGGMTKETAMKSLGLNQMTRQKKPKKITDYTESEVLEAFQTRCQKLSKNAEIMFDEKKHKFFSGCWIFC